MCSVLGWFPGPSRRPRLVSQPVPLSSAGSPARSTYRSRLVLQPLIFRRLTRSGPFYILWAQSYVVARAGFGKSERTLCANRTCAFVPGWFSGQLLSLRTFFLVLAGANTHLVLTVQIHCDNFAARRILSRV